MDGDCVCGPFPLLWKPRETIRVPAAALRGRTVCVCKECSGHSLSGQCNPHHVEFTLTDVKEQPLRALRPFVRFVHVPAGDISKRFLNFLVSLQELDSFSYARRLFLVSKS